MVTGWLEEVAWGRPEGARVPVHSGRIVGDGKREQEVSVRQQPIARSDADPRSPWRSNARESPPARKHAAGVGRWRLSLSRDAHQNATLAACPGVRLVWRQRAREVWIVLRGKTVPL